MKAAARPCTHPGCGRLAIAGSSRCALHPKQPWGKRPDAAKRLRGRHLQKARARLFAEHPLCVKCLERGLSRPSTQRDHVIPLAEGGADDDSNVQALCDQCHDEKSLAERIRGAGGQARCRPLGLAAQLGIEADPTVRQSAGCRPAAPGGRSSAPAADRSSLTGGGGSKVHGPEPVNRLPAMPHGPASFGPGGVKTEAAPTVGRRSA